MKNSCIVFLFIFITLNSFGQLIKNTSYKNQSGEKVLRLEITLPVDIDAAWQLCTTEEKLMKWMAPVVHVQLKTGGYILTNYDSTKKIADSSSINSPIINFIPNEMITLKVNLNHNFPQPVINTDKNLQHIIQFVKKDSKHTRIISSMVGFGDGADWDKAYDFFLKGNEWTFEKLLEHYK